MYFLKITASYNVYCVDFENSLCMGVSCLVLFCDILTVRENMKNV